MLQSTNSLDSTGFGNELIYAVAAHLPEDERQTWLAFIGQIVSQTIPSYKIDAFVQWLLEDIAGLATSDWQLRIAKLADTYKAFDGDRVREAMADWGGRDFERLLEAEQNKLAVIARDISDAYDDIDFACGSCPPPASLRTQYLESGRAAYDKYMELYKSTSATLHALLCARVAAHTHVPGAFCQLIAEAAAARTEQMHPLRYQSAMHERVRQGLYTQQAEKLRQLLVN